MSKIIIITVIVSMVSFGCKDKKERTSIPSFKKNITLKEVWEPIRKTVEGKDFSISYATTGGLGVSEYSIKIFCVNGGAWEKIEIRGGITEVDTIFSNTDGDFVSKEILLRKESRKEEAHRFLSKLIDYGLFELKEEKELLEKCRQQRGDKVAPNYADVGYANFYLIKGNDARLLSYQLYNRDKDCPDVKDWENAAKIQQLFEKEWYVKKHY